ncbi:Leucine rich repeat N-terminal domain [Branchiostoma belcheri]|nr:Leucine rich repeat N-terminal domain [Branchiostoma belcheri]
MRVAAVLMYAMTLCLCLLMRQSQTAPYADTFKQPVCKDGVLSGTYLLTRGGERDRLHHGLQVLRKERDMMVKRLCEAARARVAPTGIPDEIESVEDLVERIVSIVEEETSTGTRTSTQDDIEITPGEFCSRGGVANGKELYRIGKDMKALQLARNKLLAEMSSLKETLQCPDQSKTVSDKTRRRIQDTVQAYITSLHIAANDVITTPAPPDPQQVTCHDEVATTGRNMFWAEAPKKSPFIFDIKTRGRMYLRLSAERNFLPNMTRICTYPWGVKIFRRTEGRWQEKAYQKWSETSTEIWQSEEFIRMWVSSTDDGTISLYSSKLQGRPLVNWTDPNPLTIDHIAYSTVFKPGVFRFNCTL